MSLELDPNDIFRDFVTDGVPATGPHEPRKVEIRRWSTSMWQAVIALLADADPGLALPNLLIRYTVTGGTANAITATPNLTPPEGAGLALFSMAIAQANTGNVTINGKPLLTNSGEQILAGGLVEGAIVLFLDNGENFRLVSDIASQAIVDAANEAREAAVAASQDAEQSAIAAAQQVEGVIPSVARYAVGAAVQSVDLENEELHPNAVRIFIDGVYQFSDTWTLIDGILEPVTTWPGDGIVENMEVVIDATSAIVFNVPSNGSVTLQKLAQEVLDELGGGGGAATGLNIFDTKAAAEAAFFASAPDRIMLLGYHAVGDGGAAIYINPTTTDPTRSDSIVADVDGVPTWYLRVHDQGAVDLLQHGLLGDDTDETTEFLDAISLASELGLNKVICRDPTRVFRIIEADITVSVELDMGGARIQGNFGVENANTSTTILKSSTSSLSIKLKNLTIHGGNDGTVPNLSGSGGHPLVLFTGNRAMIEVDRMLFTSGGNRNGAVYANIFDSLYGEFEVKRAKWVRIKNSKFTGSPGEVLAILDSSADSYSKTMIEIEDCEFDKNRSFSPFSPWSSSSIVVYNCGKGSYIKNCLFDQHFKSAVNWLGPCVAENLRFFGVTDSQALDFNETGVINMDDVHVKNCFFQFVTGGYAIRSSARNTTIENVEINRCENGIFIDRFAGGSYPNFTGVGTQRNRDIYNVWIKNVTSNGNDVTNPELGAVDNSLIRVRGLSSSMPVYVYLSGTGVQNSPADWPSANPEYGFWGENCVLYLEGGRYQHGRTALFYMTGWKKVVARNCQFAPQPGATTNVFTIDGGTVVDLVFEDCDVISALDSGQLHIRMANSPTMTGRIYRNRSSSMSAITGGYPLTTNYTTTGTS